MARSKEFDTNLVLHKAMEVFGHYGYEGTSLPILLEGLGIARQSLYDTYGTKKNLFIKAVKHYLDEKSSAVVTYLEKSESVKDAIHAIFREIVFALQDEDRRKECFILYSAIDQVPHEPEIAALFEQDRIRLEGAFHDALVRAKQPAGAVHRSGPASVGPVFVPLAVCLDSSGQVNERSQGAGRNHNGYVVDA